MRAIGWVIAKKQYENINRKHSFEILKKLLMSVDLTSIGLDKNKNIFLSQNLSDYNSKIVFHCLELRWKRLIDATWAYGRKVFIKIHDNGNKGEIKLLSQLTRKCLVISLILMIDTHLFLLNILYCRWIQDPDLAILIC